MVTLRHPRLPLPLPLPVPPTPLVGREREVEAARRQALRDDVRLLTLVGPPGVGKTRLALAVAGGLREDFGGWVGFVPLAAVRDPGLVLPALAQALRVREGGARSLPERLATALSGRPVLLVLDNCEQVLGAAPAVGELLAVCPLLTVLATSRAPLRLAGEHRFPVPPLAVAPAEAAGGPPAGPHSPAASEAARLFVARAQAADPAFALTEENAVAVAEVCQRLDGLPLALELAAARIPLLPPRALLAGLERRLPLLTGGARDLPARHRTLRAALAWSDDLLAPQERRLFHRLAVFAGGCTLDAARAVGAAPDRPATLPGPGGDGALPAPADLDGLAALVEASLVQAREQPDGGVRLTLLETVREYAREGLEAGGDLAAVRERHAAYFLSLAERAALRRPWEETPPPEGTGAEEGAGGAEEGAWLDRLEAEHADLREALGWWEARARAGEAGAAEAGLRLAAALWPFWVARGPWREGRAWLVRLLAFRRDATPATRAAALFGAGFPAWSTGDYARAGAWLEEHLALCRARGDRAGEALGRCTMAYLAGFQGDFDRQDVLGEESLALARAAGAPKALAWSLSVARQTALRRGDFARAESLGEESLARFRALGDNEAVAHSLGFLGHVARHRGDASGAAARYTEALAVARTHGNRHGVARHLVHLGHLAVDQGDRQEAVALFGDGLARYQETGSLRGVAECCAGLARSAAAGGQPATAAQGLALASGLLAADGARLDLGNEVAYDRCLAAVRAALPAEAFAAAWAQGQALAPERLLEAAQRAAEARGAQAPGVAARRRPSPLTPREQEVAALVGQGLTNREIAARLVIAEHTAENHVVHILNKLGVRSRVQIATWATAQGLVPRQT